jgi:hypothetical protein
MAVALPPAVEVLKKTRSPQREARLMFGPLTMHLRPNGALGVHPTSALAQARQLQRGSFPQGRDYPEKIPAFRGELSPHLAKVSFPAAQLESGRYIAESDDIIAFLAVKSGREPASLPVFGNYVEGPFKMMMNLWKENQELKAAAV